VIRIFALALPFLFVLGAHVSAQEWARKMFDVVDHSFGTVARGSKQEFGFELTNIYKEDIHISGVRSSCGCTTTRVTKDTLKTHESGEVVAIFNTKSFMGSKNATITVILDKPFYAEVQLTVDGYIRGDVVFDPGEINFGSLGAGEGGEQSVSIAYAGRTDWEIVDVRSANRYFEVELEETQRSGGKVAYKMLVRLKPEAPVGYIHDQLAIVTDDPTSKTVSVPVTGQVASPLTVSPASLFLGVVRPGDSVNKRLVVRGSKPFRIVGIQCPDERFKFDTATSVAKTMHFVPVEFTASSEPGNVVRSIRIETDWGDGVSAECVATATVTE
jgi:hypothetical protein